MRKPARAHDVLMKKPARAHDVLMKKPAKARDVLMKKAKSKKVLTKHMSMKKAKTNQKKATAKTIAMKQAKTMSMKKAKTMSMKKAKTISMKEAKSLSMKKAKSMLMGKAKTKTVQPKTVQPFYLEQEFIIMWIEADQGLRAQLPQLDTPEWRRFVTSAQSLNVAPRDAAETYGWNMKFGVQYP